MVVGDSGRERERRRRRSGSRRRPWLLLLVALVPLAAPASSDDVYELLFTARFLPSQGLADVDIRVRQDDWRMRRLEFEYEEERYFNFQGDGTIEAAEGRLRWQVPQKGGRLRYSVRVDHLRETAEYDARLSHDWALLRGSDLFPPGKVTTLKGSTSSSSLRIKLPPSWKALVGMPMREDGTYVFSHEDRGYDRPSGWMLLGEKLHTRSVTIDGMHVRIGGPAAHHVRAYDVKALLRWTLPSLRAAIGKLPERLLIVLAGDPMWRGGLSGPDSLYLHADRPLIQSDGSSPVLHELIHVVMSATAGVRADWIVEAMAEYYSLELLRRSGTVSESDHERTLSQLERKAAPKSKLGRGEASVSETARGVLIMRDLDRAIRERTGDKRSLDDVLRLLVGRQGSLDVEDFVAALKEVGGDDFSSILPTVARS